MEYEKENAMDEALETTHKEGEEVKECGQPLNPKKLPYTKEHDYIVSRITGCPVEVEFGPQSGGKVPKNPFASQAQAGYLHSHPEILGPKKLAEFDRATKGMHLPKRKKK